MKKVNCKIIVITIMLYGIFLCPRLKVIGHAQEQAQVIYDFMEITEDTPVYQSPDYESKKDITIPQGESILVISQTADGWYQILYHEEILYINGQGESVEEIEISEEVVDEIEHNKKNQDLTEEEIESLLDDTQESQEEKVLKDSNTNPIAASIPRAEENNRNAEMFPKIILGIVAMAVVLSGIGYLYISKKEKIEQAQRRKQAEVDGNER